MRIGPILFASQQAFDNTLSQTHQKLREARLSQPLGSMASAGGPKNVPRARKRPTRSKFFQGFPILPFRDRNAHYLPSPDAYDELSRSSVAPPAPLGVRNPGTLTAAG